MIRIGMALVAAMVAAGCSASAAPHHRSTQPPRATITTRTGARTLATGSYCWSVRNGSSGVTGCADSAGPAFVPGLPRVRVRRGETVVVRLGFTPTAPVVAAIGPVRYRLPANALLHLRVRRGGLLRVDPRRGGDHVEYLARIVIAS